MIRLRGVPRLVDRLISGQLRRERSRPTPLLIAGCLLGLALVLVAQLFDDGRGSLGFVASVIVAVYAGVGVAAPIGKRLAYGRGYREGRDAFWRSMLEAQRRGLGVGEFVRSELERDLVDMGVSPDELRWADDD